MNTELLAHSQRDDKKDQKRMLNSHRTEPDPKASHFFSLHKVIFDMKKLPQITFHPKPLSEIRKKSRKAHDKNVFLSVVQSSSSILLMFHRHSWTFFLFPHFMRICYGLSPSSHHPFLRSARLSAHSPPFSLSCEPNSDIVA